MAAPFKFKQFTIRNDATAMKVGTDGVLLGAWASLEGNPRAVLDIGAGTGLIALMLAQRSQAESIDALEIDAGAFQQCVENFEDSPWSDRLFCYHCGLEEFAAEIDESYDLILSNPPFYREEVSSGNPARDAARLAYARLDPIHQEDVDLVARRDVGAGVGDADHRARFQTLLCRGAQNADHRRLQTDGALVAAGMIGLLCHADSIAGRQSRHRRNLAKKDRTCSQRRSSLPVHSPRQNSGRWQVPRMEKKLLQKRKSKPGRSYARYPY